MTSAGTDLISRFSDEDVLFTPEIIQRRTAEIASLIREDYRDQEPVLVSVLRGSVLFLADLVRAIEIPHMVDFIAVYRPPFDPAASVHPPVKILADIRIPIEGRDVIVVEGIVGTGYTLKYVLSYLELSHPRTVSIATMLNRRIDRRFYFPIRYTGFHIADEFVVGYGLDYQQQFRNLPFLAHWSGQTAGPAAAD